MTTISLYPDEMDGASTKLREIGKALDGIERQLTPDLAGGVPARLKADVVGELTRVRKGVQRKAASSVRQSGELRIRAALARLAGGEGTTRDVAILLSLCAGPRAIDPKKREKLYAAIIALQNAAFGGPVVAAGQSPRKPNKVDEALSRWAKWMGKGALEKKPFGSGTLSKLRDEVLGERYDKLVGGTVENAGPWLKDPVGAKPTPVATPAPTVLVAEPVTPRDPNRPPYVSRPQPLIIEPGSARWEAIMAAAGAAPPPPAPSAPPVATTSPAAAAATD